MAQSGIHVIVGYTSSTHMLFVFVSLHSMPPNLGYEYIITTLHAVVNCPLNIESLRYGSSKYILHGQGNFAIQQNVVQLDV
jgi:hypothetical protein